MPSNAELFVEAVAARRWHQRNNPRGVVPHALEPEGIRTRYLTAVKAVLGDDASRIVFLDDSIAAHAGDASWQVVA